MEVSVDTVRPAIVYQHLLNLIVPRPIAWVSTISPVGVTNLAPFSFFTGVGSRPPSLLFCPANRRDGSQKDTLRNICTQGEFVVNVVPVTMAAAMDQTSAELTEQESEFEVFGITSQPSCVVRPPRVAGIPASIECRLERLIEMERGPGGANIVIGRILHLHLDDACLDQHGFMDPSRLNAIGRLGGAGYCRTHDQFQLSRDAGR